MNLTRIGQTPWLGAALLAIAAFAVTLGGTYIYDDHAILLEDPRIADPSRWGEFITGPYNDGVDMLYRPLASLSYAVQWWLHGDRPWVFHLVNLLLHAAVSALVALLGTRLIGPVCGWVAGALFAVHPVHVEAVANIVGRAELLCAIGMLGAMILLFEPLTPRRAAAIAGCFAVSILSKEQGMLVPPLLAGMWWLRPMALRQADSPSGPRVLAMLILWMFAGYIIWRESQFGFFWERQLLDWTVNPMVVDRMNPHGGSIGMQRWLVPLAMLGRYTVLLLAPVRLLFDYGALVIGPRVAWSDPYLWLGIAALLGWMAVVGIAAWKRNRIVLLLALGLGLAYAMIGNFILLIGVNFAERLMYVPSIFFLLLLAMLLIRLPQRVLVAGMVLLVSLGMVRTVTYAARWNNELRFYETSLAMQPKSIRLYMLQVDTHRKAGRLDEAAEVASRGRQMLPEYWEIWWQSGVVAMEQQRYDLAAEYFLESFRLNPKPKTMGWLEGLSKRRSTTTRSTQ